MFGCACLNVCSIIDLDQGQIEKGMAAAARKSIMNEEASYEIIHICSRVNLCRYTSEQGGDV